MSAPNWIGQILKSRHGRLKALSAYAADKKMRTFEDRMATVVSRYFARQQRVMVPLVRRWLEAEGIRAARSPATLAKALQSVNRSMQERLMEEMTAILRTVGRQFAIDISKQLETVAYQTNIPLKTQQFVKTGVPELVSLMDDTTISHVVNKVGNGMTQNSSIDTIIKRLDNGFLLYRDADTGRSRTIAEDLVGKVASRAEYDVIEEMDLDTKKLRKGWFNIQPPDKRIRHTHKKQHGVFVAYDAKFPNGCLFPRDPDAEIKETANCRCRLQYEKASAVRKQGVKKVTEKIKQTELAKVKKTPAVPVVPAVPTVPAAPAIPLKFVSPTLAQDTALQDIVRGLTDAQMSEIQYASDFMFQKYSESVQLLVDKTPLGQIQKWMRENSTGAMINNKSMKDWEEGYRFNYRGIQVDYGETIGPTASATKLLAELVRLDIKNPELERLTTSVNKITFTKQSNVNDDYWRKTYKNFNQSAAVGGGGEVVVFNGARLPLGSFVHELGHNLASKVWGFTEPSSLSPYYRAANLEAPLTEYAKNSISEDFAEHVELYVTSPVYLLQKSPLRFQAIDDIIKRMPGVVGHHGQ